MRIPERRIYLFAGNEPKTLNSWKAFYRVQDAWGLGCGDHHGLKVEGLRDSFHPSFISAPCDSPLLPQIFSTHTFFWRPEPWI